MSLCCPCTKLKTISLCTDSLIVGTVAGTSAPYIVYLKSLATGKIFSYSVTSSPAGLLTLQFTAGFPLATLTGYELWANRSGDSIDDQVELTIGATTDTCYQLQAAMVYNMYYDENFNYTSQTLEIASISC